MITKKKKVVGFKEVDEHDSGEVVIIPLIEGLSSTKIINKING